MAEGLEQKIKRRAEGIIVGLTERLSAEKAKLASLEKEVRVTVQEEIDTAGRYNRYSEKKNELEEMQRLRQVLSMKSASERIDAALPRTSFVQVVDAAVAPDHPTPYSRPGSIGLILLGLLLDGISLSVLRGRPRLEAVAI
jgi:hypothetical protein